jgi:hypothetical protein
LWGRGRQFVDEQLPVDDEELDREDPDCPDVRGQGIEPSAWESLRRTKVFLKAPITTP